MKFGMPLDFPYNRTFQFPKIGNTNMADEQTCEVESTLAPLAIGSHNDVRFRFLENTNRFIVILCIMQK
jgi:hypothetical protein